MGRSSFGSVETLKSGRHRARYAIPGSKPVKWVNAPMTFTTKKAARGWLAKQRVDIEEKRTRPEIAATKKTLGAYADEWLKARRNRNGQPLRPTTKKSYRSHLDTHIRPVLGDLALPSITPEIIEEWYDKLPDDSPTAKAHTYSLLRTIMRSAARARLIDHQPVNIEFAAATKAKKKVTVATPEQVQALAGGMPEHLRLAVHLGAWAAVRAGEALELRRKDVAPDGASVHVERAVTFLKGGKTHIGPPKTDAGERTVALPPHVAPLVVEHLEKWVADDDEALLFPRAPGERRHTPIYTLDYRVGLAVTAAELPDGLTFHHLRHTGLTFAGRAGATVAELMARAGHSTPSMAMRYQHATSERDAALAAAMSEML